MRAYDDGYEGAYHDDEFADVRFARSRLASARGPGMTRVRPSAWRNFVARYGWRAHALPVLLVITVVALATVQEPPTRSAATPHVSSAAVTAPSPSAPPNDISLAPDDPDPGTVAPALRAAELPPGDGYTLQGTGTFQVLKGTSKAVGSGPSYAYTVEVERGLRGVSLVRYAGLVSSTLADRRSWAGHGVRLQRVDSGHADFRITLTSAKTTRKLCGYEIEVETSCYADSAQGRSPVNRVVLNVARWVRGATAYVGDLAAYRLYMINHETGHALGHQHAHECLTNGLAPVMLQQTFGLRSAETGDLCSANPWPYPAGVAGAPGAEQLDTPQNDEYSRGGND